MGPLILSSAGQVLPEHHLWTRLGELSQVPPEAAPIPLALTGGWPSCMMGGTLQLPFSVGPLYLLPLWGPACWAPPEVAHSTVTTLATGVPATLACTWLDVWAAVANRACAAGLRHGPTAGSPPWHPCS